MVILTQIFFVDTNICSHNYSYASIYFLDTNIYLTQIYFHKNLKQFFEFFFDKYFLTYIFVYRVTAYFAGVQIYKVTPVPHCSSSSS